MSSATIDLVGVAGDRTTQGLGRIVGQYVNSPKLVALIRGLLEMGQDMERLWQMIGRYTDPNDDATQVTANTDGAVGAQLQAIGRIVGVTNYLPTPYQLTLSDAQFLRLILARIYRNHVKGATIDQLIASLQLIMPDLTTGALLTIVEIQGQMTTMVIVGREVELWEAGICALPSGIARTKHGVLPKPTGVKIAAWWWDEGCFTFALEDDLTTLVDEDGEGFNTSESITEGIGRWPEDF